MKRGSVGGVAWQLPGETSSSTPLGAQSRRCTPPDSLKPPPVRSWPWLVAARPPCWSIEDTPGCAKARCWLWPFVGHAPV